MKFTRTFLMMAATAAILSAGVFTPSHVARAQSPGFTLPPNTVYQSPRILSGGIPVLSSCGTSPVLATGSSDGFGKVTLGSGGATGCTITFSITYNTAPECFIQDKTGVRASASTVTTTTTLVVAGLTAADVFAYQCSAYPGG